MSRPSRVFLIVAIGLLALNMRPALSTVGPVLDEIMRDTGLSAAGASLLTTLPVLCLGLFGPLAPILARRIGTEQAVLALMVVLAVGTALRLFGTVPALMVSAVLAGAAIGIVNVLLPGLVKRDFADRAAAMTGVYTMALCAGAAVAAGVTQPLQHALGGWDWALAFWTVPAVIAGAVWAMRLPPRPIRGGQTTWPVSGLLRDPLAWQVTLFMGLQSSLAYTTFGWLAPILRDRGMDAVAAGFVVSASVMTQVVAALVAPILAGRARDQRGAAVATMALTLAGFLGCLFAPPWMAWGFGMLLGLGQGGSFSIAIALIVMRSRDGHVAAHLSSMAQSIGYTLAAGGPFLVGVLHDVFGGWTAVGILIAAIATAASVAAMGAGRKLYVGARLGE